MNRSGLAQYIILTLLINLVGCAVAAKQINLQVESQKAKVSTVLLTSSGAWVDNAPSMQVSSNCKDEFLILAGPWIGIPLPIFPWVPDIYSMFKWDTKPAGISVELKVAPQEKFMESTTVEVIVDEMVFVSENSSFQVNNWYQSLSFEYSLNMTCKELLGKKVTASVRSENESISDKLPKNTYVLTSVNKIGGV